MTDLDHWQLVNERYLETALGWLRPRLATLAARYQPSCQPPAADELALAQTLLDAAESAQPAPAMIFLSQQAGLSRFERNLLLLCVGLELDTRIADLCAQAQDNPSQPYPTFALALALLDSPSWDALSPEGPLRYWRLIEVTQPDSIPLTLRPLRADERIVNYVKGVNYLDDRLAPLVSRLPSVDPNLALPPSQEALVNQIVRHAQAVESSALPVIQLLGSDPVSKQLVASRAADRMGLYLYKLPAALLPQQPAELETLARLWHRESMLLPVALYLDALETADELPTDPATAPLYRFLARSEGLFFLDTRDVRTGLNRPTISIDAAKPNQTEQRLAWVEALGPAGQEAAGLLAGQFNLGVAAIRQIAAQILVGPNPQDGDLSSRAWNACLLSTRPRLDQLAQRLEPKATWDHIVLPDDEMRLLHQIADQVRQRNRVYEEWGFGQRMNRGFGIIALFAGESGTGKTMAAEVIANDLGLNLYRIDLSGVVSKYIGETEKNLRRLFDAAEDGGAILFFDEADALFGKRSQVSDSHDRYANIEINYLLQRMEAYRSLAILATNRKGDLDEAFIRRLRFIVNFQVPTREDRRRIWRQIFPPETPLEHLDLDRLSRFNLTGGNIHNIAINAAFLAAQANTPVTMPMILSAARTEFLKVDRLIKTSDFVWHGPGEDEDGSPAQEAD